MSNIYLLLSVVLMLQASRACNEQNEEEQLVAARQQSDEYFANAFGFNPNPWVSYPPTSYYQLSAQFPEDYVSAYQGRTPFTKPNKNRIDPFKKQFVSNSNANEKMNQAEGRLALGGLGANIINTGLFNNRFTPANTWRPFANFANRIPVSVNPDFSSPLANFDACTSPSGEAGICAPGSVCSLFGGRPSGSCVLGKVCCINAITTCGGTVTLNNTYWQSPSTPVSAPSTCTLTVRMDTKLAEQLAKPICQIRLDFVSFTTAQPTAGSCTDTFQVGGATTVASAICGENSGQHMYLDVPSSAITPSNVQLMFNFMAGTSITRSWNIKIAMLPCGASYLAPTDCLQYFSAASGRVKSFNWMDVAGTATRQLNNQNYNICFRTELVSSQKANKMCVSVCAVTNGGDAFSITTPTSADAATAAAAVAAATTDLANAQTALTNAQTALTAAQTTLATNQAALVTAQTALTTATDAVTAAEGALTTAQAAVPVAETALTDAQTVLTDAQAALATAQGTLTTARETLATAEADLAAAQTPEDIATAQAAVDTARTDVNVAQTAFTDAETVATNAQTNADNAQTAFDNAQTAANDAQTALTNAQTAATDAQTAVTDAQTAVDNAQADVVNAQGPVAAAQIPVATAQAALTAAQTAFANAANSAAPFSGVGTSVILNGVNTATCLYDFLLIAGARDLTNVEADRFCGNALNPAIIPVAASVQVCTPIKPFKMTYRTDETEDAVVAGVNVLPAPADSGNVGFCLDFHSR